MSKETRRSDYLQWLDPTASDAIGNLSRSSIPAMVEGVIRKKEDKPRVKTQYGIEQELHLLREKFAAMKKDNLISDSSLREELSARILELRKQRRKLDNKVKVQKARG